jgi:hypothetical protein
MSQASKRTQSWIAPSRTNENGTDEQQIKEDRRRRLSRRLLSSFVRPFYKEEEAFAILADQREEKDAVARVGEQELKRLSRGVPSVSKRKRKMQNPTIVAIPPRHEDGLLDERRPLVGLLATTVPAPREQPPEGPLLNHDLSYSSLPPPGSFTTPTMAANNSTTPTPNGQDDPVLYQMATASSAWQYDDQSPRCNGCGVEFNAINRRHHCRYCGAYRIVRLLLLLPLSTPPPVCIALACFFFIISHPHANHVYRIYIPYTNNAKQEESFVTIAATKRHSSRPRKSFCIRRGVKRSRPVTPTSPPIITALHPIPIRIVCSPTWRLIVTVAAMIRIIDRRKHKRKLSWPVRVWKSD